MRKEESTAGGGAASAPLSAGSNGHPTPSRPPGGDSGDSPHKNFLLSAPTLSLPKGGGAIKGIGEKFSANPVTGTGTMSIPIAASPGRSGFGPQLSLNYDSGSGNGPFGLGWSLSLPSIARKTDKGLPRYLDEADSDTFMLAGAEDLVPVLQADGQLPGDARVAAYGRTYLVRRYRPRVEGGFALIERWTLEGAAEQTFWRTVSRDNLTSWFGRAEDSRVFDPDDPTRVFQWQLCETCDDKGNVAVYRYKREDGAGVDRMQAFEANRPQRARHAATYIEHIWYGNREPFLPTLATDAARWHEPPADPDAWMFELRFDYGEYPGLDGALQPEFGAPGRWTVRRDAFSSHRAGFEQRTWRLCRRVLMIHHFPGEPTAGAHCLVRSTDFHYEEPADLDDPGTAGYTVLRSVSHRSYQRGPNDPQYEWRELPPVVFGYSAAQVDGALHRIAADQLPNLPVGTQGPGFQWVDLDGEGLSGVLSDQGGAWHYAPNRGGGRFGASRVVARMPATASLAAGRQQLMDLAGDGEIDLVDFGWPTPGFHERDRDEGWKRYVPFASLPEVDWQDPNLRFVDLTGDGHADALITEHEVFTWYPSLDERGFAPALRQRGAADEDAGPRLVFDDGTQTIFLADMCGDGLVDLVRIRAGDVCFWPNLGYGRFGRKVTLANAPRFDAPDQFDPQRIRLADIDGSGPVDIVYLGREGAQLYFNRSGNSLSDARIVPLPVATENLAAVQVADPLGLGTACLVWNSHLPADAAHPVRYIDLMGGVKPHLLTTIANNLGARSEIEYTPSTVFYLRDLAAGRPWATRLPFPVHCVSRVVVHDDWRGTSFSSRYSYHHGCFDGVEREFRGFARVEQIDSDRYRDPGTDQPPVKTITWFHVGVADERRRVLELLAAEYFPQRHAVRLQSDGSTPPFAERPMPEPELPEGLDADEWREALRACKGMVLRQEIYELDPATLADPEHEQRPVRLFSAATHHCRIQCLQRRGTNRHGVFLVSEREALTYHYEMVLPDDGAPLTPDPRVAHTLNLRHDEYGNVLQSVAIGYGRWRPGEFTGLPRPELIRQLQGATHVAYTEIRFTADAADVPPPGALPAGTVRARRHNRLRLPCETRSYELKGVRRSVGRYFRAEDFGRCDLSDFYGHRGGEAAPPEAVMLKHYHEQGDDETAVPQKRIVEHTRTLYLDDAADAEAPTRALPFGRLGPRGLKHEDYKLALTEELLGAVFGRAAPADPLADKLGWPMGAAGTPRSLLDDAAVSGYIAGTALDPAFAGQYWMRSGRAAHRARFFLPERYTDPFGNHTVLGYDRRDSLFIESVCDARGNLTTIAQQGGPAQRKPRFDYRVLAPLELVDLNGNHTEVVFDILGLPVLAAVKGKRGGTPARWEGDHLEGIRFEQVNPAPADVAAFCLARALDEPRAREWLGSATTRFVYHHGGEPGGQGGTIWQRRMPGTCAIRRQTHVGQLRADELTRLQVALECSDGFGAVLMQKLQAEPDPADARRPAPLRWIVNGLTVLNNKGNPVRQFEPAFSADFGCEWPGENGVSTRLVYDAAGRVVRTELPDGSFSRVEFSPWFSRSFDASDTVTHSRWYRERLTAAERGQPAAPADPDEERLARAASPQEKFAARKSALHADTPAETHLDSLGREVLAIAHNRSPAFDNGTLPLIDRRWSDQRWETFTRLDAEGKPLWIRDARGNLVMQYVTPPKPTRLVDTPPAGAGDTVKEHLPPGSAPAYDMAGNLLYQHSMDAGDRWMLADAAGQPLLSWDYNERQTDRGAWRQEHRLYRSTRDALRRPSAQWLQVWQRSRPAAGASPQPWRAEAAVMLERFTYQDGADVPADADRHNLNGQLVQHHDPSGVVRTERRGFTGQVAEVQRQLVADPRVPWVDWQAPPTAADARLEADPYILLTEHDALGRMTRTYNWHRAGRPVAVYEPSYNARGLLHSETLRIRATKTAAGYERNSGRLAQAIVEIRYDAKGQKTWLALGNGTVTQYRYDERSFRLRQLYTRRGAAFREDCDNPRPPPARIAAPARPPQGLRCGVQNLHYTYDAAGNITHIRDDAQQTIWFRNQVVDPSFDYTYDATHRLIEATGREQAGRAGSPDIPEGAWPVRTLPTDDTLRRYRQRYVYDSVGNFERMEHMAEGGSWTRRYAAAADSNRLLRTWEGNAAWSANTATQKVTYGHDTHGSMLNLKQAAPRFNLHWDQRDMIRHIDLGGGGEAWYQYDSGKQRTRKFITRQPAQTNPDRTVREERIYLGGFELYRRYANDAAEPVEVIESHHLFEGEQRVLLVDDVLRARGDRQPGPSGLTVTERSLLRYQYTNHLGSVAAEFDEGSRVITYEEFHAYGTAAYRCEGAEVAMPAKRYRYTRAERDTESGLAYHVKRYYTPLLGGWASSDPLGIGGGMNVFEYCRSSPIGRSDVRGEEDDDLARKADRGAEKPNTLGAKTERYGNRALMKRGVEFRSNVVVDEFGAEVSGKGDKRPVRPRNSQEIDVLKDAGPDVDWKGVGKKDVDSQYVDKKAIKIADQQFSHMTVRGKSQTAVLVTYNLTALQVKMLRASIQKKVEARVGELKDMLREMNPSLSRRVQGLRVGVGVTSYESLTGIAKSYAKSFGKSLIPDEVAIPYDHLKLVGGGSVLQGANTILKYSRATLIDQAGRMTNAVEAGLETAGGLLRSFTNVSMLFIVNVPGLYKLENNQDFYADKA